MQRISHASGAGELSKQLNFRRYVLCCFPTNKPVRSSKHFRLTFPMWEVIGFQKRFCLPVGDTACRLDYGIIMYCTRLSVFRRWRLIIKSRLCFTARNIAIAETRSLVVWFVLLSLRHAIFTQCYTTYKHNVLLCQWFAKILNLRRCLQVAVTRQRGGGGLEPIQCVFSSECFFLASPAACSLKLTFWQYPAIHTNYIISHCTTLQYNHNTWHEIFLNTKNNEFNDAAIFPIWHILPRLHRGQINVADIRRRQGTWK